MTLSFLRDSVCSRVLVLFCITSAFVSWASLATTAQDVADLSAPRDLLRTEPFDRVTLIDGTTLLVDPVSPRPLPDPKEQRAREKAEAAKKKSNVVVGKLPDAKRADDREGMIALHTREDDPRDFLVRQASIQKVDYFEDMLLAEAEALANRRRFELAFEHLLAVQARDPGWPGLAEQGDRLLFLEGKQAIESRQVDRGLRLLRELHARRSDYPGLQKTLGDAFADRINSAFEAGLYELGRRELASLQELEPDHPEAIKARERFIRRTRELAQRAETESPLDRVETLEQALRVWPKAADVVDRYRVAFVENPVLHVAVDDVPRPLGPWIRTAHDARIASLVYLPILSEDSEAAMRGETTRQLAAGVTTSELGRRVLIQVRPSVSWNDGSRNVGASDLARTLIDRALPTTIGHQARWAGLVDRVEVRSDRELELVLNRSPLALGSWLLAPVGPVQAGRDGRVFTSSGTRLLGTGWYGPTRETRTDLVLDRASDPPEDPPAIARIHERALRDPDATIDDLLRDDVTVVARVSPRRVPELKAQTGIQVGRYTQPSMHWIALDGRNPVLRNRSLRRALSFAIDRQNLLRDTILQRDPGERDQPADGIFPKGSYADAPDVAPLEYDLMLARILVAAARTELGGDPLRLRFEYPASPVAQAVVPEIGKVCKSIGLELELIERPGADLESELLAGRTFDLAYRQAMVREPAFEAGPSLCPAYDAPSDQDGLGSVASPRILQILLELERSQDWPTARGLVLLLDRTVRDELPVIPLWQIDEHYAFRDRLHGLPEESERLYDSISAWSLDPRDFGANP